MGTSGNDVPATASCRTYMCAIIEVEREGSRERLKDVPVSAFHALAVAVHRAADVPSLHEQ